MTPTPLSETRTVGLASPVYTRYIPIDVTAGWVASPVDTRLPAPSWVDWSNVSKVSCSRK